MDNESVTPSMDPSTLNVMPHVIIDDENLMADDDVAIDDCVQTSDETLFFSHLEYVAFYSNLMNWVGGVSSLNNNGGSIQLQNSSKESSKLKHVQMKHKNRESSGSVMFKGFMNQQHTTKNVLLNYYSQLYLVSINVMILVSL